MPSIDEIYGTYEPPADSVSRYRTPEVVTPSPAVRENALAVFRSDPAALKAGALSLLDYKVKPVETLTAANELADRMAQAKTLLKNIETRRKQIVEPLKHEATDVDAEARRWREPVEKYLEDAERVLLAFRRKQADDARREEENRQKAIRDAAVKQNEAEIMGNAEASEAASTAILHLEAEAPAQEIKGFKTESGTTSVRKTWKVEVVAPAMVPRAYCTPDTKLLQAAVNAGERSIDGCNVFEAESLTVRTR